MGRTERSNSENFKLLELAQCTQTKDELFEEFFKGENRSKMGFSASFIQVLQIPEMRILLIGGALKHAADCYQFALVGYTSTMVKDEDTHSAGQIPYFFG